MDKKILLAALCLYATSSNAALDIRVIDGDTINTPIVNVNNFPSRTSVRLLGVNTPETRSACPAEKIAAEKAKVYIRNRINKAAVINIVYIKWDKYGGRVDGTIFLDGKDLSADIISSGNGVAYISGPRVNVWCPKTP